MNRTIRRIVSKRIIVFIAIITLYQRVSAEGMSNVIFKKNALYLKNTLTSYVSHERQQQESNQFD